MYPAHTLWRILQREHGQEIKGDHIKDLDCLVRACRCEAAPIRAYAHAFDLAIVCPKLLHELDAPKILLPEFHYTVDGGGNQEIGNGGKDRKA
jgi:hypothetical protein